jgi:glutamate/tyrosine decarboxylase-like PLP-dependent enzyme
LPFWFSLAVHGTDEYSSAVETTLATAREVAAGIAARAHLRLVHPPELSVVLFERPGWEDAQYREWSHREALEGSILCVPTTWRGRTVLRLAFVNPDTDPERVLEVLDTLR